MSNRIEGSEQHESPREAAVRALLVTAVTETPRPRRRWRVGTTVGAAVCIIAGAAAGGAITAAASPDPAALEAQSRAAIVIGGTVSSYARVVGTPVGTVGSGAHTVTVGPAPKGADEFVWSVACRSGDGRLSATWTGTRAQPASCPGERPVTGRVPASEASGRTLSLRPAGGVGWTLTTGWVQSPPLPPASAAQQEATEDGIVTRSEYLAAFDRFQGCMTARGASLGRTPTSSLFVAFGASDVYALDWCTASEFDEVDAAWQGEHPVPAGADSDSWGSQRYDPAADRRYAG